MAGKATAKAAPSGTIILDFDQDKETKGTHRFQEQGVPDGGRAKIGSLYITKEALEAAGLINTTKLVITVEAAE